MIGNYNFIQYTKMTQTHVFGQIKKGVLNIIIKIFDAINKKGNFITI